MAEKKKFPMKKSDFLDKAKPITVKIGDMGVLIGKPMEFKKGSVGFNVTGKVIIEVNGIPHDYQVSGNIVGIGSGEAE